MKKTLGVLVVAGLAASASAQVWNEVGDAGDLLSNFQACIGVGPLTSISGNNGASDIDLYQIAIKDEANFRASLVGGATFDSQLFLFDATGKGVAMNDDEVGSTSLQSTITSQFVTANGVYFLAVARYDRDPLAAGSAIWNDSPFRSERAPDGPGAAGTLSSWDGATSAGGTYRVTLSGASFVPAPGALALMGLGGLAVGRRRR